MDDILALKTTDETLSLISTRKVDNVFPTVSVPYRLAIIGEAPGAEEETQGIPFVGGSGRLLDSILSTVGIHRAGCFVGNICKYRPPDNKIENFGLDHPKVTEGWNELQTELKTYAPHCILALGNIPLHFITGRNGISNWQGSILQTTFGKCVPALHPAAVLRDYKTWPLLRLFALRAREEATSPKLSLPERLLETDLTPDEICYRLDNWSAGRLASFDIEGGLDAFPCCSVSDAANRGFSISWSRYNDTDQGRVAVSLSRFLHREDIPMTLQNSLYDRMVLAYGYNMLIRNVREDTMDKSCCIYPELPRGLSTITAVWTHQPYYKSDLMIYSKKKRSDMIKAGTYDPAVAQENQLKGCILDSCVTMEACRGMDAALNPREERFYRFSVGIKNPLLYMQIRGFKYDTDAAETEKLQVKAAMSECASRLELQVSPMQFTKKDFTNCVRGEKNFLADKRIQMVLYDQKGYPVQKKGRGPTAKRTADVQALLKLKNMERYKFDTFLPQVLLHRKLESILETLNWKPDPKDGRMKCGYNQYGKGDDGSEEGGGSTETMRLRCSTSIIPADNESDVGGNLQTVTKKLRKLFLADEGHWLFQCDLAGADGWTVAAHCLRLGDPTMWDDYHFGLKPARIIALFYDHPEFISASREELKAASKEYVDDDGWLYFASKRCQHATNYGVKEKTMAAQIMVDSYKITGTPIFVDLRTCAALQRVYLARYSGIYNWHRWAEREVFENRNLTSASGHTRTFFGRRRSWDPRKRCFGADHETWKEFLADEPQENTTYATNLALHNLWNDSENRITENGGQGCNILCVEPLHQVHDALIGQFRKTDTEWAVGKIKSWFNNRLIIAGTEITIPFDGKYGLSWGHCSGVKGLEPEGTI